MGFLDKLFGEKEEEEKPLALSLGKLKPWLERRAEETEEEAVGRLNPMIDEITASRDDAKEVIAEIRDYEFPQDLKKKVYKPVLTSKPAYAKAMLDGLGEINSMDAGSIEDLEEYHRVVKKVMKKIQKTQLGKGRYMTITFRDEMLKIGGALNSILDALKSLGEALEEEKEELARLGRAITMAEELNNKVKAMKKGDKNETPRKSKTLKAKRKAVQEELRGLMKSQEHKELENAVNELEKIKKKKAGNRMWIMNSIGPLARALRKYKKLVEDGEAKGDAEMLEEYITNPVDAIMKDEGCKGIKSILTAVQGYIEKGSLQLDLKEGRKVQEKIKQGLSSMTEMRAEMLESVEMEKRLHEIIDSSRVEDKKKALEKELKALDREIEGLGKEKTDSATEIKRLRAEIENLRDEIIKELEDMEGKEVRVELPAF